MWWTRSSLFVRQSSFIVAGITIALHTQNQSFRIPYRCDTTESRLQGKAPGSPQNNVSSVKISESPFVYPELSSEIHRRKVGEKDLSELRAKARNRIFILQSRLERREISPRDFDLEMHKLKEDINKHAQKIIYGVGESESHLRQEYLEEYGCVKWTKACMEKIAKYAPIIEIGAGNGYWKNELVKNWKVDIIAFDDFSMLPVETKPEGVEQADASVVAKHSDRTLLLVAPPPNDMAVKCLSRYYGNHLIYVGEGRDGAHADSKFFDELESNWDVIDIERVDCFPGCFEKCFFLKRRHPRRRWWFW